MIAFVCDKCCKLLTTKHGFQKHTKTCKGIHPLECKYCYKIFNNRQSKYKHGLKCGLNTVNDDIIENLDVKCDKIDSEITMNNITNNMNNQQCNTNNTNVEECTTNNHCTTNNITNNSNTYIIKLEEKPNKQTNFETEEISVDKVLENFLDFRSQHLYYLDVFSDFCNMIFSIPTNRCVKKDNLRTSYSKVHLGNNHWKVVADRKLYEKLLIDVAKTFMKKLDEFDDMKDLNMKYKKLIWDIRGKTDHLSYGTYDDNEKELIKENKIAKDNVKYAVHNNSV
jgi:hypothetical protein